MVFMGGNILLRLPIIKNGKLVGVVTHVLVNDSITGYGIFIENMMDVAG